MQTPSTIKQINTIKVTIINKDKQKQIKNPTKYTTKLMRRRE